MRPARFSCVQTTETLFFRHSRSFLKDDAEEFRQKNPNLVTPPFGKGVVFITNPEGGASRPQTP